MEGSQEYNIFMQHYAMLCSTLTDINNLLPHFVTENIISLKDIDDNDWTSKKIKRLLMYIEGPLRTGNTHGFYTMLGVMEHYGTWATQELATKMRGLLPEHYKITEDHKSSKCTRPNNFKGDAICFIMISFDIVLILIFIQLIINFIETTAFWCVILD